MFLILEMTDQDSPPFRPSAGGKHRGFHPPAPPKGQLSEAYRILIYLQ